MTIDMIFTIIAALLAISEALSFIPSLKSNGVFQLFWNVLKTLDRGKNEEGE